MNSVRIYEHYIFTIIVCVYMCIMFIIYAPTVHDMRAHYHGYGAVSSMCTVCMLHGNSIMADIVNECDSVEVVIQCYKGHH